MKHLLDKKRTFWWIIQLIISIIFVIIVLGTTVKTCLGDDSVEQIEKEIQEYCIDQCNYYKKFNPELKIFEHYHSGKKIYSCKC